MGTGAFASQSCPLEVRTGQDQVLKPPSPGSKKVLLLIEGISETHFKLYLNLLRRFSEIQMPNLTMPGNWRKDKSPYKYFDWYEGSVMLHFVDRSMPSAVKAPESLEYQASKRVWAVIGLLHYPTCPKDAIAAVDQELQVKGDVG
jgi:hypothetical protein